MTDVRTIVLGVGNPLRSDDAVGLHVARHVRERVSADPAVEVVELWTGGLRLAEAMSGYERALLIDALGEGRAPAGSVCRLELSELGRARNLASAHDTSLPAALETWRALGLPLPASIVVFGIGAQDTQTLSESLSARVAEAVPVATRAVLDELQRQERPQ